MTLLLANDAVAGVYVALPGAEVASCRKADTLALLRELEKRERDAVLRRLAAVRSLFAPVAANEWYLSKLAVASPFRGLGLGRRLVERYLAAGAERGFSRYRLDVDAADDAAVELYRSYAFRVVHDASSEEAKMRYLGMCRES
jgi:GNAT superfamily N-acetyltransferase